MRYAIAVGLGALLLGCLVPEQWERQPPVPMEPGSENVAELTERVEQLERELAGREKAVEQPQNQATEKPFVPQPTEPPLDPIAVQEQLQVLTGGYPLAADDRSALQLTVFVDLSKKEDANFYQWLSNHVASNSRKFRFLARAYPSNLDYQPLLIAERFACLKMHGPEHYYDWLEALARNHTELAGGKNLSFTAKLDELLPTANIRGEMDSCVDKRKTNKVVRDEFKALSGLGVLGSPAVFLNHKRAAAPRDATELDRMADAELSAIEQQNGW